MQKHERAILFAAFCAAAGSAAAFYLTKSAVVHVYAQSDIHLRPYQLIQEDYVVADSGQQTTMRTTISRRSDGARHIYGVAASDPSNPVRRVEFPSGTFAFIMDSIKSKSEGRLTDAELAAQKLKLQSPPANCAEAGETVEATDNLLGYSVVRLVRSPSGDTGHRTVVWRFLEFACDTAQVVVQTKAPNSQDWSTSMGKRLVSITEVEPSATMFSDWTVYEEMKPSDLKRKVSLKDGKTPESCPKCFTDEVIQDKNYSSRR